MIEKKHVVYVTPELAPYAKSGEMADVTSALPKYLSALDLDISLFMPMYRLPEIETLSKSLVMPKLMVPLGEKKVKARIFKSEEGNIPLYFVDSPQYFWREHIYGTGRGEYLDNDERFIIFNRAVLEFLVKKNMSVDIFHCHNWPTALIPVFLKTHYARKKPFRNTASVLTLHNIAYQGEFPPDTLSLTGLNWKAFTSDCLSFRGKFNFLKAGVLYADVIHTVSSAYKKEILSNRYGYGMEKILSQRKPNFFAIRNGIDYETWNPSIDPYIHMNYDPPDLQAKAQCKQDLLKEFGLQVPPHCCVLGLISYITPNKGFDILLEALDQLMEKEVGLVILGQGDEELENRLLEAQKRYPGRFVVKLDLSPRMTHKLVAGVDIILIPSRMEPCGLNQLYGFRYGTVPLVRATGGLKETVIPFDSKTMEGNGFVFKHYSAPDLLGAVDQGVKAFQRTRIWKQIVTAGVNKDYSWESAAKRHARLYRYVMDLKTGG